MRKPTSLLLLLGIGLLVALAGGAATAQENTGRLCVTAFRDANIDGTRDALEPLLADVVVTLHDAQLTVLASYLTDGESEPYCFDGLPAGNYTLIFAGGLVAPADEDALNGDIFTETLPAGESLQVAFPARSIQPVIPQPPAAPAATIETTVLRLGISLVGTLFVVGVMVFVGLVIYVSRFRGVRDAPPPPPPTPLDYPR